MSKLTYSLATLNFQEKLGLAGLVKGLSQIKQGLVQWQVSTNKLELNWECPDKEALQWLVDQLLQVNEDGLINLVGHSSNLCFANQDDRTRHQILTHNVVLSTFCQHNTAKKRLEGDAAKKEKSFPVKFDSDGESISYVSERYQGIQSFVHQGIVPKLLDKKDNLSSESVPLASAFYLGGNIRHESVKNTGVVSLPAARAFLLAFCPIACQFYQVQVLSEDRRSYLNYYLVAMPEIYSLDNLLSAKTTKKTYRFNGGIKGSIEDCALDFLALVEDHFEGITPRCQIQVFHTTKWSPKQNSRVRSYWLELSEQMSEQYRILCDCVSSSKFILRKDGSGGFYKPSLLHALVSKNIANNQPIYYGFTQYLSLLKFEIQEMKTMFEYLSPELEGLRQIYEVGFSNYLGKKTANGRKIDSILADYESRLKIACSPEMLRILFKEIVGCCGNKTKDQIVTITQFEAFISQDWEEAKDRLAYLYICRQSKSEREKEAA